MLRMNSRYGFLWFETSNACSIYYFQRTLQAENKVLSTSLAVKMSLNGYYIANIERSYSDIGGNINIMTKGILGLQLLQRLKFIGGRE